MAEKNSIAKNTMLLYFRTFITMIVGLYTSRVILQALGETSYGVYDVVGGVVAMFAFLNGSLAGASSRFLTYAIGQKDYVRLNNVFSAALNLHFVLAVIIIFFGETIGLWFLYHKLVIPPEQMNAAFWVLQCSIVTAVFTVISVPYNASLISHENMAVFAYVSLYDAIAKLAIAYVIAYLDSEKLIMYAVLLMINSLVTTGIYRFYAIRHYQECRIRWVKDKSIYKDISGYSLWDMLGNVSVICQGQGINILLNMFFGPVANTARAIAYQILNGITAFVSSFTTASRPRVIKYCAEGNHGQMYSLTFITGKISYFLVFFLTLPILFEIKYILHLWLGDEVPQMAYIFTIIVIITALMQTYHTAYLMTFHAIGKIRTGNLVCGTLRILALPLSYFALKLHAPAWSVFVIILVVNTLCHIISWKIVYGYIRFDVRELLCAVYVPTLFVSALSVIVPLLLICNLPDDFMRFVLVCCLSELIFLPVAYYIGFTRRERIEIVIPILKKFKSKIPFLSKL